MAQPDTDHAVEALLGLKNFVQRGDAASSNCAATQESPRPGSKGSGSSETDSAYKTESSSPTQSFPATPSLNASFANTIPHFFFPGQAFLGSLPSPFTPHLPTHFPQPIQMDIPRTSLQFHPFFEQQVTPKRRGPYFRAQIEADPFSEQQATEKRRGPYIRAQIEADDGNGKFRCETCNIPFSRRHNLQEHNRSKHEQSPKFTCEFCSSTYHTSSARINHLKKMHRAELLETGMGFKCDHCSLIFLKSAPRSKYDSHILVHLKDAPVSDPSPSSSTFSSPPSLHLFGLSGSLSGSHLSPAPFSLPFGVDSLTRNNPSFES